MKYRNALFFSLPLVFLLGFLSGSYWQAMLSGPREQVVVRESIREREPVKPATKTDSAPTTDDPNLTAALEDPDFKRVHDFLTRENPMQMNLDPPKDSKSEKPVPFSERPPVQFTPFE